MNRAAVVLTKNGPALFCQVGRILWTTLQMLYHTPAFHLLLLQLNVQTRQDRASATLRSLVDASGESAVYGQSDEPGSPGTAGVAARFSALQLRVAALVTEPEPALGRLDSVAAEAEAAAGAADPVGSDTRGGTAPCRPARAAPSRPARRTSERAVRSAPKKPPGGSCCSAPR